MNKITNQFLHEYCKREFSFLESIGFNIINSEYSNSGDFRAGFLIEYLNKDIKITMQYSEMEFIIAIQKGIAKTSYFSLDKSLFNNKSGFRGIMFPRDKLGNAIKAISNDINKNYRFILNGNEDIWTRIASIESRNSAKFIENAAKYGEYAQFHFDRENAELEFKQKNYGKVIKLLNPIRTILVPSEIKKLEYAIKQITKHKGKSS